MFLDVLETQKAFSGNSTIFQEILIWFVSSFSVTETSFFIAVRSVAANTLIGDSITATATIPDVDRIVFVFMICVIQRAWKIKYYFNSN